VEVSTQRPLLNADKSLLSVRIKCLDSRKNPFGKQVWYEQFSWERLDTDSGDPSLRVGSSRCAFWSHLCRNHSSHLARLAFDVHLDVHFPDYDLPSLMYFQGWVRKRPPCFGGSHYTSILLEAGKKLHKADLVPLHWDLRTDVGIRLDPSSVESRRGLNGNNQLNLSCQSKRHRYQRDSTVEL
jgi:hypothetical protein